MLDYRLGEDVVATQLEVAPDAKLLARNLLQSNPEPLVKGLYPALEPVGERLVVYVRVTYKEVVFKVGERGHLRLLSQRRVAGARRGLGFCTKGRKARRMMFLTCA